MREKTENGRALSTALLLCKSLSRTLSKTLSRTLSAALIISLSTAVLLSGCVSRGHRTLKVGNVDGTITEITYEVFSVLTRAPRYTRENQVITMQFNGTDWFTVTVIGEEERARIEKKGTLLARSSNIDVYENAGTGADVKPYSYVMALEGTDSAWILFRSEDAPDISGYGTDFDSFITYSVDGAATVPDLQWIMEE